jgi:LPS O-antigen subunit length determinant protein (WzzB/FepE family)
MNQFNFDKDNQDQSIFTNEIDLKLLIQALLKEKILIGAVTAIVSILSVLYALNLPNIYQSTALVSPAQSSKNSTNALGQLGGLAGLAGISMPSLSSGSMNSVTALKKLETLSFFETSIYPNIYLHELMAFKSWNRVTNLNTFDEDLYDINSQTWVRIVQPPNKSVPSPQESFQKFMSNLSIYKDPVSGFITIQIKHQSPFIAKKWVELVLDQINLFYREKDREQSIATVNFLNEQLSKTSIAEVKQAIAVLLQEEAKKLALIEASKYYVYDYIDAPAVMEKKSMPNRAMISIAGFIIGFILALFLAIFRIINPKKT